MDVHGLFIRSLSEEHLRCFQVWAARIKNCYKCVCSFLWMEGTDFFGLMSQVPLLCHVVRVYLVRHGQSLPQWLYSFTWPPTIYLFLEREKEGRRKGRETSMCGCLSHAPNWAPGPQPRHVPWLGIEPATLWFTGRHSIHWAGQYASLRWIDLAKSYPKSYQSRSYF